MPFTAAVKPALLVAWVGCVPSAVCAQAPVAAPASCSRSLFSGTNLLAVNVAPCGS